MALQKATVNGVACVVDSAAPTIPVSDVAADGGDIVAAAAALLANRGIANSLSGLWFSTTTGIVSAIPLDTDTVLAANSDTRVASQKAVKAYVDNVVSNLLELKGSITGASSNPNYPIASAGDAYVIATTAGKVGGASGKSVDISDLVVAIADNAGGTEASVGTSWVVLEHNLVGALLTANNLSELTATASTVRTNLGLAIGTNVQAFAANLSTYAGITPSANVQTLLGSADYAAFRSSLGTVLLKTITAQGANVTTGETDLATYTVAAGKLAADGDSIWFEASGTTAANGNSKTIRVRFGSGGVTQVFTITASANAIPWTLRGRVIRTGAATQKGYANIVYGVAGGTVAGVVTTLNHTLSGTAAIRVTGQSATASNDILLETFIVGFDAAAP